MTRPVFKLLLFYAIWVISFQISHAQTVEIESAFSEGFESPVGIEHSHDGSSLLYIVSRSGKVVVKDAQNPDAPSTTFIDISDKVIASGELGLLGMAFSPDFQTDNTFYLYYAYEAGGEFFSTLARYKASGGVGDPASEERLFELFQPQDNHNGGQITFGPDGYLYVGLGDGGRDSSELAQDTNILNGSILRIDVSPESGYEIPPDNPFVNDPNGLNEIYAWGFRNPWRISFDKQTGDLWVADVGQKDRETIYIVEKGKNYGWPIIEGTLCYPIGTECDKTGLEEPLFEYPWDEVNTGKSITGGFVYRGEKNPSLYGKYIYGDFISQRIWALEIDHETHSVISNIEIGTSGQLIPTFGMDGNGEMYVGGWSGGTDSQIFRFAPELTLTTAALKSVDGSGAVQLSWETNTDTGIESFEIYRGGGVDSMELFETVSEGSREFIDSSPLNGATFYAVRAIESNGDAGELSNSVSYFREESTVSESWKMISIPYETDGVSVPNALIYSFDGIYSLSDQMEPNKGYLARSTSEGGSSFTSQGLGIMSATIELSPGWNLIGAPVSPVSVETIKNSSSVLNSTPVYEFNGSVYEESDFISPGKGYWVFADDAGQLSFDISDEQMNLPLLTTKPGLNDFSEELDKIEFTSSSVTAELYVVNHTVAMYMKNRFRLPPLSPDPIIDVRSAEGFKIMESSRFEPVITASEYPVTIRYSEPKVNQRNNVASESASSVAYEVTTWRDGKRETSILRAGSTIVLSEPIERIEFLRIVEESEIVRKTQLLPSYPNPFNPTTTIIYRLAEEQRVSVTVFDAAGRRIATLIEGEQEAGQYSLPFNASGLASGIYFVRFSAGDVMSTQKLTLIK